jgi:hypothetical protein
MSDGSPLTPLTDARARFMRAGSMAATAAAAAIGFPIVPINDLRSILFIRISYKFNFLGVYN